MALQIALGDMVGETTGQRETPNFVLASKNLPSWLKASSSEGPSALPVAIVHSSATVRLWSTGLPIRFPSIRHLPQSDL